MMRPKTNASYGGLTRLRGRSPFGEAKARVSILFAKILTKKMDGRVKPGHDESGAGRHFPYGCRFNGASRRRRPRANAVRRAARGAAGAGGRHDRLAAGAAGGILPRNFHRDPRGEI